MTSTGSFLERRVGRCSVLDVVMMIILAITASVAVVLIVTLTTGTAAETNAPQTTTGDDCIDIAVVGAGIGGSYTGWRLRNKNLSVSVFEYSDRVGGRLFTAQLPDFPGTDLELGGMRFLPNAHHILNKTVSELGLDVIDFPPGTGRPLETTWYARGRRMRFNDLTSNQVPFNLDPHEQMFPSLNLRQLFANYANVSETSPTVDEMYALTTDDGTPLYKMSLDNFYGRYMSREAYDYLHAASGFDMTVGPHSVLSGFQFVPFSDVRAKYASIKTIRGGMGQIPQSLMRDFTGTSERHQLLLNHQLVSIERRKAGGYHLRFRRTKTRDGITTLFEEVEEVSVCARKVVLAAQKSCIEDIDFPVFKNNPDISRLIDSVWDHPAGKVFLAYDTQWWKTNSPNTSHSKSDLPNLQTYDWPSRAGNVSVILASYHDGKNVPYWRELSKFGTPIPGSMPGANAVTDVVKKRLEKYLSLIYNFRQEDIPEAVGGGMMLWDTYPFQAGWHVYKPGVDEREVQARIHKPSPSDNVFIVSNSWAPRDLSGWSEGTLEAAEEVLSKYLMS